MRHSWNIKDIKLGVHSLTHSILNSITLTQAGLGLSKWWVASLISAVSSQCLTPSVVSIRNSLLLAQRWRQAAVVWYFIFCCSVFVLTYVNVREAFFLTAFCYEKKAAMESTEREMMVDDTLWKCWLLFVRRLDCLNFWVVFYSWCVQSFDWCCIFKRNGHWNRFSQLIFHSF